MLDTSCLPFTILIVIGVLVVEVSEILFACNAVQSGVTPIVSKLDDSQRFSNWPFSWLTVQFIQL